MDRQLNYELVLNCFCWVHVWVLYYSYNICWRGVLIGQLSTLLLTVFSNTASCQPFQIGISVTTWGPALWKWLLYPWGNTIQYKTKQNSLWSREVGPSLPQVIVWFWTSYFPFCKMGMSMTYFVRTGRGFASLRLLYLCKRSKVIKQ